MPRKKTEAPLPDELIQATLRNPEIIERTSALVLKALDRAERLLEYGDTDQQAQMIRFLLPTMNKMMEVEKAKEPVEDPQADALKAAQEAMAAVMAEVRGT